ncbi:unnamed protein product [Pseudo-nitzschia multistriata]|uniref:Uncharacterized protein n=1 Tax=Pseudo-nitzschia multistriata TaxID=183589 RepID=A0A448Z518_9STRA|nr:unnamed protein product [Pseudo-nitzschia multistriata]
MKNRLQVVPISSDDHSFRSSRSARSTDTSSRSSRSHSHSRSLVRLRSSSMKSSKRQSQQAMFSKRPYMYKTAEQTISSSPPSVPYPNGKRNRSRKTNKSRNANTKQQITVFNANPVPCFDWVESGMDFLGCGTIADASQKSKDSKRNNASPNRHGHGQLYSPLREEDILANKMRHLDLMGRDYMQLHEDFFDSLLKEEGDRILATMAASAVSSQQNKSFSKKSSNQNKNAVHRSSTSVASENTNCDTHSSLDNYSNGNSNSNTNSGHTRTSLKTISSKTTSSKTISTTKTSGTKTVSSIKSVRLGRCGSFCKKKKSGDKEIEKYDEIYNPDKDGNNAKPISASNGHPSTPLAPSSDTAANNAKKLSSSNLSIRDIMSKTHLEAPSYYLHMECKLQKDKGKGETLGNSVSAEGRELTLTKLRDKMKLIVEVSGELETSPNKNKDDTFKSMSAGMKRRRAKIALIENNNRCTTGEDDGSYIIETRSMIEFQLGFLSMQYGLLLRWDAYRSGQIVFVCLRKMCHDSFYTKIPSPPPIISTSVKSPTNSPTARRDGATSQYPKSIMKKSSQERIPLNTNHTDVGRSGRIPDTVGAMKKREITPPFVIRSPKGGNHAIYQRSSGATEVVLVDAPYRVPHPKVFAPSILSLDVHRLTGLDPKSRWTLIMTFDGDTEIAHLRYNRREGVFETTRSAPCTWELDMMPHGRAAAASFDVVTGLEIRLFEQRPKHHRLRGVANGVAGMVGGRSSSSSSYVPAGSDPFSMSSPSNSYVIQNQRLTYYSGSGNHNSGNNRIYRTNSESSLGSNNSGTSSLKKSTSRLASTMTVPLGGLVCQPSTSQTTLWKLTIPFTHNENAEVTLTLMHQSEYAHWLYQELRARRKEEVAASRVSPLWRSLVSPRKKHGHGDRVDSDDDFTFADPSDDTDDMNCIECIYFCCVDPR